jgi:hypothetical protein
MRTKSKTGLAILAGGLSFVGSANATDLIQNGSFESITGGTPQYGGITDGTAPGWNGVVSTLPYSGTAYFAGPAIPASESPGSYYSWRHQSAVGAYSLFSTPTAVCRRHEYGHCSTRFGDATGSLDWIVLDS